MKSMLFLLEFLLFVCMLDAGTSYRPRYDETLDSKAQSNRMQTFTSLLTGVFSQVGPSINITRPGIDNPFTVMFSPFEVPILQPAKTFRLIGIIDSTVRVIQILAITEIDDVIHVSVYFNLRTTVPRNVSQGLFDEEDFTDLTLDDLNKRCDCSRVFVQEGPLDFRGTWQPCQRSGASVPNYQSRLTCTSLSVSGRREFQREGQLSSVCRNRRRIGI